MWGTLGDKFWLQGIKKKLKKEESIQSRNEKKRNRIKQEKMEKSAI